MDINPGDPTEPVRFPKEELLSRKAKMGEVVSQDFLVSPGTAGIRGVAGGLENRDTRVIQATLGVQVIQALADIRGIRDIRGFRVEWGTAV